MKNPVLRTFFIPVSVAVTLLLAGGLGYYAIPQRTLVALSLGSVAVGILIVQLWLIHRRSAHLLASVRQLARGELDQPLAESPLNPGAASVNLLYHKLREAAEFVETLEETETTAELHFLRPDERLGQALREIKSTLRAYREEEEKRHWSAQGLTYFADILRGHSDDIAEFSDLVIRHLVSYLAVNQGGMFVKTEVEGKTWLELTACYAYEKKKHAEKRVATRARTHRAVCPRAKDRGADQRTRPVHHHHLGIGRGHSHGDCRDSDPLERRSIRRDRAGLVHSPGRPPAGVFGKSGRKHRFFPGYGADGDAHAGAAAKLAAA